MLEFFVGFVFWWAVVDGDTLKVSLDTWPNHAAREERVRLVRIDAPEVHRPAPDCELALGRAATEWTRAQLAGAKRIEVRVGFAATRDNFGRILGDVIVDGESLSERGLKAGVFRPYADRTAGKAWCL